MIPFHKNHNKTTYNGKNNTKNNKLYNSGKTTNNELCLRLRILFVSFCEFLTSKKNVCNSNGNSTEGRLTHIEAYKKRTPRRCPFFIYVVRAKDDIPSYRAGGRTPDVVLKLV